MPAAPGTAQEGRTVESLRLIPDCFSFQPTSRKADCQQFVIGWETNLQTSANQLGGDWEGNRASARVWEVVVVCNDPAE